MRRDPPVPFGEQSDNALERDDRRYSRHRHRWSFGCHESSSGFGSPVLLAVVVP